MSSFRGLFAPPASPGQATIGQATIGQATMSQAAMSRATMSQATIGQASQAVKKKSVLEKQSDMEALVVVALLLLCYAAGTLVDRQRGEGGAGGLGKTATCLQDPCQARIRTGNESLNWDHFFRQAISQLGYGKILKF